MRNRIARLLHRWAYHIEGHRAEHRAGVFTSSDTWTRSSGVKPKATPVRIYGGGTGGMPPERLESRGWNA